MKKILLILLAILFLSSFCACESSLTNDNESTVIEVIVEDDEIVYKEENTNSNESNLDSYDQTSEPTTSNIASKPDDSKPEDTSSQAPTVDENIYYLSDPKTLEKVKLNGRCEKIANGVNLNMSGSAIEFNTDSSSVLMKINADKGVFYSIMVDGKITLEHKEIEISGDDYIIVARGLSNGAHNVKIIRESESRASRGFCVTNIQFDDGAKLLERAANKDVIEFLGDSLTSGYGNLANNVASNASELKFQSATKAYPYLMASKLGMDYRIVSMSGIALGKRPNYPTFSEFYGLENYHDDKTKKYSSSNPADVNIVVVNLGTNDSNAKLYDEKDPTSVADYGKRYADLITNIGYSKDVKVVFVSGVCWCHTQTAAYNEAMVELKARGYNNTYTIDIRTLRSGGGGHPSAEEHVEVADTLYKFFKDNKIA